ERRALGGDGAPLGRRDVLGDRLQLRRLSIELAEKGAVDEEIGIAADRRGEMRIAAQREAEMADVAGAVRGLRLGAQDEVVDQGRLLRAGSAAEDAVEQFGPHPL